MNAAQALSRAVFWIGMSSSISPPCSDSFGNLFIRPRLAPVIFKELCTRLALVSTGKGGEMDKLSYTPTRWLHPLVSCAYKPSLPRHLDDFILGHFNTPIEYGSTPGTGAVQTHCRY